MRRFKFRLNGGKKIVVTASDTLDALVILSRCGYGNEIIGVCEEVIL